MLDSCSFVKSSRGPHCARVPRGLGLGALLVGLLSAAPALAQQTAASGEVSVQRFDPAPGPRNFFVTRTARSDGEKTFSAGLMLNYSRRPFVVRGCLSAFGCDADNVPREKFSVVNSLFTGDLLGSFTLLPPLQFGLKLPVTVAKGQGIDKSDGSPDRDGLQGVAIGDPTAEGKYRFFGTPESPVALAGGAYLSAPLARVMAKGDYIGDRLPTFGVRGIADIRVGPWSAGANLGGVLRKVARVGTTRVGTEFRYSFAGGYQVSPALRAVLEGFGHTRFAFDKDGGDGLEALLGAQVNPVQSPWQFSGGLGVGVSRGIGVPIARGFLGVMYLAERRDQDQDGLFDDEDSCITEAEDRDGYQDSDGCPDSDNDDDRIQDSADKCPDQAEDPDGVDDLDGCPDLDNDQDGVSDERDACPKEKETRNGFKDDDGCPDEVDTDLDGVPDARDQCPKEAEDTDGFKDEDGCPDPDNDGDGVLDASDECGEEMETVNGFQDEDGCPDEEPDPKKNPDKPKASGAVPSMD